MKRKIVSLLLAFIMFAVALPFADNAVYAGELTGDINGDGRITPTDYLLTKRIVLGTYDCSAKEKAAADLNGDGRNSSADYLLLKRYVLGTYDYEQPTHRVNVALGKLYTVSSPASSYYPDTYSCELTDGVIVTGEDVSFYDARFSGYSDDISITVDLKNQNKYINGFEIHYLSINDAGIDIPSAVSVYGSDDNASWQSIGTISIPAFNSSATTNSAVLNTENEMSFRYIRFNTVRRGYWLFLDEVMVYADVLNISRYESCELEKAYNADNTDDATRTSNIAAVSSGAAYNPKRGMSVISTEKTAYIANRTFDTRISTSVSRLTDGVETGANFELDRYIGLDVTNGNSVTIDLGAKETDICGFALHCLKRSSVSVVLPYYVDISVSVNGNNYTNIGRVYGTTDDIENFCYFLSTSVLIEARYVRFTMSSLDGYIWIEEAKVYANRKEDTDIFVYGNLTMDFDQPEQFWSSSESDYNTSKNLILGKPQQIVSDAMLDMINYGDPNSIQTYNDPETSTILTDGQTTSNTYCYSGGWMHFYMGGGRTVYYDLGKTSRVESFSVRALEYPSMGISSPQSIKLVLSENGTDWYLAGEITNQSSADGRIKVHSLTLTKPVKARYAAVYFNVNCHVFLDEITVNGKKNTASAYSLAASGYNTYNHRDAGVDVGGYIKPSPDILGGVHDVMLIYHNVVNDNENFYKPYVAYCDRNGNILDTLFDGYLYLPSTMELPSGGRPYGTNIYSDWDYLFNDIFSSTQGVAALDRTAATVKSQLGLTDYKLKVFIAIPHLDTTLTDFGDVDGDGISENLTVLENRVKVARTYAQRVINRFNAGNYSNLELCGFYWFHEEISGKDITTAQRVSEALNEIGMPLFWIPYYNAAGYNRWNEFGFEVGCLQPNYAFSETVSRDRLYYAAMFAKRYGMCIEIETSEAALSSDIFYRKYIDYLWASVKYGYIDSIHMYYQSGSVFYQECYSSNDKVRLLYDYTYQFVKGTLDIFSQAPDDYSLSIRGNTAYSGKLHAATSSSSLYKLNTSPEHGTVTVLEGGSFVYYPNKGFSGTDTFTYCVSEYYEWSDPVTVTVNVR